MFSNSFAKPFSGNKWRTGSSEVSADWWLSGGIDAADVAGVWQPKGAASLDASYLRLAGDEGYADIDPAVVGGVAPTWNSGDGWIADGSKYLITNIILTSQAWSVVCRVSGLTSGSKMPLGMIRTVGGVDRFYINIGGSLIYANGGQQASLTGYGSTHVLSMSGAYGYKDGILDSSAMASAAGLYYGLYLLAANRDGAQNSELNGKMQAVAIYKSTLTPAQVLAVSDAMAAL